MDVVKANTADWAVKAMRFAKGIVMETVVMLPSATPTVPVAEQVRVKSRLVVTETPKELSTGFKPNVAPQIVETLDPATRSAVAVKTILLPTRA